jgi:capsular polysaccharide biosynthesis protein
MTGGESMELEYVLKAVRKYWLLVVAFAVAGAAAAVLLVPEREPEYEATALVLVAPGSDEGAPGDRYVMSQMAVLQTPQMTAGAIEAAGVALSPDEVSEAVDFEQQPGTDVVQITATAATAETAQAIANGYVDAYFETLEARVASSGPDREIEILDRTIAVIEEQIRRADEEIAAVLQPYFEAPAEGEGPRQVPALEQIAPALATERNVLGNQYTEVLRRRTELEFAPRPEIRSQVVQRAELPSAPVDPSGRLLTLALVAAGLFGGVLVATALARSSRRVLDAVEVSAILGAPIAASVKRQRSLARGRLEQPAQMSPAMHDSINQVCVQAERQAVPGVTLSVVVAGTQNGSGATTVATAMAYRYAELGSKVLLVNADHIRGDTSRRADLRAEGLSALVEGDRGEPDQQPRLTGSPMDAFTHTDVPNLIVVGYDERSSPMTRRARVDVMEVMEAARKYADVVIFDTGPILDSVSSIKLAQHADVTVLVVPVRRQRSEPLRIIARQLEGHDGLLLPVTTSGVRTSRTSRSRVGRSGHDVRSDRDDPPSHTGPVTEPAERAATREHEETTEAGGRLT